MPKSLMLISPPLWLSSGNWQTPRSSIYCFNHVLDEHTNHQLEIWDSLGLNNFGMPVNVDSFLSPYNHSRQLTTSFNVPTGDDHACTIQDNKTPKISNIPVFLPVWTYLLTDNFVTGLSDHNFYENKLILKPNPTTNVVSFDLPSTEELFVKVYDHTGKLMLQKNSSKGNNLLDLSSLNTGLYIIQIQCSYKIWIGKVVKQ